MTLVLRAGNELYRPAGIGTWVRFLGMAQAGLFNQLGQITGIDAVYGTAIVTFENGRKYSCLENEMERLTTREVALIQGKRAMGVSDGNV